MNIKLTASGIYGTLIVVLCAWLLQSFLLPLLVACVTAVASWPLYEKLAARAPWRTWRTATPLVFTCVMTVFVLAPLTFAFAALLIEAHTLLAQIALADEQGLAPPHWLQELPLAGSWLGARWERELAHPGALLAWAQRTDPGALLGWARSLGQFMARHAFVVGFTILVLFFVYQSGQSLAGEFRRVVRHYIGEQGEACLGIATRALRASVNSMLVVGLFVGLASGVAYAIAGVPHAAVWAAITGSLALVPFLGYAAVAVLTLQLAMTGAATPALLAFWMGCAVLFLGDKVVRPAVVRGGTRLPFVWVLMGCLGGFEALGLVGLVIGPVVLTLASELWQRLTHARHGRHDCFDQNPKAPAVRRIAA